MTLTLSTSLAPLDCQNKVLEGLLAAITHSAKKIARIQYKLEKIVAEYGQGKVALGAVQHYEKNEKLLSIAAELKSRIIALDEQVSGDRYSSPQLNTIDQFEVELDLFQAMHFKVAKDYFSFVQRYYTSSVIQLSNMVA